MIENPYYLLGAAMLGAFAASLDLTMFCMTAWAQEAPTSVVDPALVIDSTLVVIDERQLLLPCGETVKK